jgi:hypothetical protein
MIHDRGLSESPILTPFYIKDAKEIFTKKQSFCGNYLKKNASDGRAKGKLFFVQLRGRWLGTFKYDNRPPKRSHATDAPTPLSNLPTNTKLGVPLYTLDFEFFGKFVVNFWSKRPEGFVFYDKLERWTFPSEVDSGPQF